MFLINPESFQKLQNSTDIINPHTLSQLDLEMRAVLNSKIKDNEKWSKYQQVLQRFLHFSHTAREAIKVPLLEQEKVEEPNSTSPVKNDVLTVEQILETVPKNLKNKSSKLLQHITKNDYIQWDKQGVVRVDNQLIKDSNIIDIVNDILRNCQPKDKKNQDLIVQSLKQINTPMEFIQSKAYLDNFINYTTPNRESSISVSNETISSNNRQKKSSESSKSKQGYSSDKNTAVPTRRKKKTSLPATRLDWEKW